MLRVKLNIVLLFAVLNVNGQHYYYGDNLRLFPLESALVCSENNTHSMVKPFNFRAAEKADFSDSLLQAGLWSYAADASSNKLVLLPVLNFNFQRAPLDDQNFLSSGIGAHCEYNPNAKISFFSRYSYYFGELSNFYLSRTHNRKTVMGVSGFADSNNLYKIHDFEFNFSAALTDYFILSIGRGKNFWGDGYRSLLLSDFASSYPYFKVESEFWNVKYVNLYSMHSDFYLSDQRNIKFSSSHLLSWNITKAINLSVFESVVWAAKDSLNQRNFDVNYLNPVIFFRPVEYSIGSADNSLLGASIKGRFFKNHVVYGQLILDEFNLDKIREYGSGWWANKYGVQLGYKNFNIFGLKGLGFQLEYNEVRPFTYSHVSSLQNYGHHNQSLAHPLESNFKEALMRASYLRNNFSFEIRYAYQQYGASTYGNYGGDMFSSYTTRLSENNHFTTQGELNKRHNLGVQLAYMLVARANTSLFCNFFFTKQISPVKENHLLFCLGIKSNLWNQYLDY